MSDVFGHLQHVTDLSGKETIARVTGKLLCISAPSVSRVYFGLCVFVCHHTGKRDSFGDFGRFMCGILRSLVLTNKLLIP
jgi:hypothetical protein